ncbi:hypothetical protein J6R97_04855 [bacterium]|nr:hypothetical protein [bacterium]
MQIAKIDILKDKNLYNTSFQSLPVKVLNNNSSRGLLEKSLVCLSAVGLGGILKKSEFDDFLEKNKNRFIDEEMLIINNAKKKNPELAIYLLSSLREDGLSSRFNADILNNDLIFETDPELVKKLVEMKITESYYRFENEADLVNVLNCYKFNPERTQELLDEKMIAPYENSYMHPYVEDIEGILLAEELNKEVAERFENIKLPNGLKRFQGAEILALVKCYMRYPKSVESIISAKYEDGTPLFLYIPTDMDKFSKLAEAFEKCPNIVDFMKEFPLQFLALACITHFADAYEKDANYTKKLLLRANSEKQYEFLPIDIKNIVDAHLINHDLTEKLLAEKNNEGKTCLDSDELLSLVHLEKENPVLFNEIITQKDSSGNYRIVNFTSISTYKDLKEKYGELFFELLNKKDEKGNFIYQIFDIEGLIQIYKTFAKEDVDFLLNLKDQNGDIKLKNFQAHVLLECLDKYPDKKDELFSLVANPFVTYDIVYDLQKLLSENANNYNEAYNLVTKISEFLEKRNVKPKMYINDSNFEGDIIVNLDSHGFKSFVFNKDGDLKLEKDNEVALNALYEDKIAKYDNGQSLYSIKFMNYYENSVDGMSYPMETIKEVHDANNILYTIYSEKSKDYPNKLNLYIENNFGKKVLAETKKDINGDFVSTKDFEYKDINLIQNYRENSKFRKNIIKISDKHGNVYLDSSLQVNTLAKDKFESIENGKKYLMEYFPNKVVVTKEGEAPIEISIGENDVNSEGVISKDLLHLVKQLPGSTLYNLHKYGVLKIWINENKISSNNAFFNSLANKIELSKYQSTEEKLSVLLHEIGHYLDYHKLRSDKELSEIFKEEKTVFYDSSTRLEQEALNYIIDSDSLTSEGISSEAIAETYALINTINKDAEIELRGLLFQQYFPRTFAKIAELLND